MLPCRIVLNSTSIANIVVSTHCIKKRNNGILKQSFKKAVFITSLLIFMFYLRAIFRSIYDARWLTEQKDNGKKAANYIVLFILLLSAIYAGYLATTLPPQMRTIRDTVFAQVPSFTADIRDGILEVSNLEQPFEYAGTSDGQSFRVVVDTVNTSTIVVDDTLSNKEENILLITRDQLVVRDAASGKTTLQDFSEVPDMHTDREEIVRWTDDFLGKESSFFVFLLIAWFILFTFGKVVYLLILTSLVFVIARLAKKDNWKFGQIYTMGLFAITGPSILVGIMHLYRQDIPYAYTILTLGLLLYVVFREQKHKEISPAKEEEK
ncbi:MAG TPA: hypothetical protein DCS29_03495 [Candidatus Magasanikbacteria bacterium]|nr:hypothetical protein [Candidatus Magasanikbacteria bacterium]